MGIRGPAKGVYAVVLVLSGSPGLSRCVALSGSVREARKMFKTMFQRWKHCRDLILETIRSKGNGPLAWARLVLAPANACLLARWDSYPIVDSNVRDLSIPNKFNVPGDEMLRRLVPVKLQATVKRAIRSSSPDDPVLDMDTYFENDEPDVPVSQMDEFWEGAASGQPVISRAVPSRDPYGNDYFATSGVPAHRQRSSWDPRRAEGYADDSGADHSAEGESQDDERTDDNEDEYLEEDVDDGEQLHDADMPDAGHPLRASANGAMQLPMRPTGYQAVYQTSQPSGADRRQQPHPGGAMGIYDDGIFSLGGAKRRVSGADALRMAVLKGRRGMPGGVSRQETGSNESLHGSDDDAAYTAPPEPALDAPRKPASRITSSPSQSVRGHFSQATDQGPGRVSGTSPSRKRMGRMNADGVTFLGGPMSKNIVRGIRRNQDAMLYGEPDAEAEPRGDMGEEARTGSGDVAAVNPAGPQTTGGTYR